VQAASRGSGAVRCAVAELVAIAVEQHAMQQVLHATGAQRLVWSSGAIGLVLAVLLCVLGRDLGSSGQCRAAIPWMRTAGCHSYMQHCTVWHTTPCSSGLHTLVLKMLNLILWACRQAADTSSSA
jgi:hypothetical protein